MQKTTRQESRSLSYAIKDGVYYAIMAGMGESYISPFAIFLKATNSQIGFLASIPPLIGAFVQLISVNILKQIKDRMTVIITGVIAQALMWLPILLLPMLFRPYAPYLLIIGVTSYFIFGNFATPAWSSLMGDIVPEKTRSSYFGYRNKVMSIFSLGALTLGGLILHGTEKIGNLWIGFSVLFTVALITRLVSSYYLSIMDNPLYEVDHRDDLGLIKFRTLCCICRVDAPLGNGGSAILLCLYAEVSPLFLSSIYAGLGSSRTRSVLYFAQLGEVRR